MRKIFTIGMVLFSMLCAVAGSGSLVFAQEQNEPTAEAMEQANKLFELTFAGTFLDQLADQVWRPVESELKKNNSSITAEELKILKDEYLVIQKEQMAEILTEAPRIYARHFTADELKELYEFQSSPLGMKSLQVMPAIMGELMPMIIKHSQSAGPRMMEKLRNKIKERGYKI